MDAIADNYRDELLPCHGGVTQRAVLQARSRYFRLAGLSETCCYFSPSCLFP